MPMDKIITMILQGVLVPLLMYGIAVLRNYLAQKIRLREIDDILDQATEAAFLAVKETAQTYVDAIKGTAEWNAAAQASAFDQALLKAKMILSDRGLAVLESATGSVEAYLTAAIEAAVRESKTPARVPGGLPDPQ